MWIDDQPGELLRHWLRHTATPMLATRLDGEVLWCNEAFEQTVGYTISEFLAGACPVKWTDITVDHGDLAHDRLMADAVVAGERSDYQIAKQYRAKTGRLVDVIIHVMRYPLHGEFECFLVSVYPVKQDSQHTLEELREMRAMLFDLLERVERGSDGSAVFAPGFWERVDRHPKMAVAVVVFLAFLLCGDRVLEIIRLAIDVFPGE